MNDLKDIIEKEIEEAIIITCNITKEDLLKLNQWERSFIKDIDKLLEQGFMLSDKQLAKLQEIDDKLCKKERFESEM